MFPIQGATEGFSFLLPLRLDVVLTEESDFVVGITVICADAVAMVEAELKLLQVLWAMHPERLAQAGAALASISGMSAEEAATKAPTALDMELMENSYEHEEVDEEEAAFVLPNDDDQDAGGGKGEVVEFQEGKPTGGELPQELVDTVERLASVVGLQEESGINRVELGSNVGSSVDGCKDARAQGRSRKDVDNQKNCIIS